MPTAKINIFFVNLPPRNAHLPYIRSTMPLCNPTYNPIITTHANNAGLYTIKVYSQAHALVQAQVYCNLHPLLIRDSRLWQFIQHDKLLMLMDQILQYSNRQYSLMNSSFNTSTVPLSTHLKNSKTQYRQSTTRQKTKDEFNSLSIHLVLPSHQIRKSTSCII